MPVWVATRISTSPFSPASASALWSPSSTALNGCFSFHSGCLSASRLDAVEGERDLRRTSGCSHQSVPSLSNTAIRSAGGTKSGEPSFVTFATNAVIAFFGAVSFHDGSGSGLVRLTARRHPRGAQRHRGTTAHEAPSSRTWSVPPSLDRFQRSGTRRATCRCRGCTRGGRSGGSASSSCRCTGTTRRAAPARGVYGRAGSELRSGPVGLTVTPVAGPLAVQVARRTSRRTTPTRCRPCRTARSRSAVRLHRGGALEPVGRRVLVRELALPDVRLRLAASRRLLVAPDVGLVRPARRGRRTPTRPRSAAACRPTSRRPPRRPRRRERPGGRPGRRWCCPAPRGASSTPPGVHFHHCEKSFRFDRPGGRREDQRAGDELAPCGGVGVPGGNCLRISVAVDRLLGGGDVAGRLDERAELGVGDFGLVHPEPVDPDAVGGLLVRPAEFGVGAHRELAAGNPDHARRCRRLGELGQPERGREPAHGQSREQRESPDSRPRSRGRSAFPLRLVARLFPSWCCS